MCYNKKIVFRFFVCLFLGAVRYWKIIFELLTNTAVVNAYLLFTQVINKKVCIARFCEELVSFLLLDITERRTEWKELDHCLTNIKTHGRCLSWSRNIANNYGLEQAMKGAEKCPLNFYLFDKCFFYSCYFPVSMIHTCAWQNSLDLYETTYTKIGHAIKYCIS